MAPTWGLFHWRSVNLRANDAGFLSPRHANQPRRRTLDSQPTPTNRDNADDDDCGTRGRALQEGIPMQQRVCTDDGPEFISLQKACRRVGISVQAAIKLPESEFPPYLWLGAKRMVSRRRFEAWLAEKVGDVGV